MQIKIYVVDSEKYQQQLNDIKIDFITYFGGLTEQINNKGYWVKPDNILCYDNVTIWEIYTDKTVKEIIQYVTLATLRIKEITKQLSQLIVVDNKPIFL